MLASAALLVPLLGATAPAGAAQEPAPAGPVCTEDVPPATFGDRREVPQVHRAAADCAAFLRIALGAPVGQGRTALQPRADVSRAAMASFLARTLLVAGVQLPPPSLEPFYDVPQGSAHETAIQRLRAAGIVQGRGPATYAPADPVSRGQTASLLLRAVAFARGVDAASLEREGSPFTDVAGTTHAAAIGGAHALGLVRGVTSTQYAPGATTTRAQMTSLLVRALESEVQPVRPCTNDTVGYTVRPPASWTVDQGDTRPACSVFAPPDAGGSAIVVREDPGAFEALLSEGPSASAEYVVTHEQTLLIGPRRAAVQEREATGRGERPEGLRYTVWLVDRGNRTLVAETQQVPHQDYRTNQGVMVRMLLSLQLPDVDPTAFVPPATVATSPPGEGSLLGMVEVRTGRHAGFDRVVLELDGAGTVGWRVAYTDDPRFAGRGDPVDVAGNATLQISVSGVGYPLDTGVPAYDGPERLAGPGASVPEVVVGVLFEGLQGVFVGTRDELPFRVFRLSAPERLVVDVAHPPAG